MFDRIAWGWVILSLLLGVGLVIGQMALQPANAVEVVVDASSYRAQSQGRDFADLLRELKASGATAVAVAERGLKDFEASGDLKARTGAELRREVAVSAALPEAVSALAVQGALVDGYTYVLTDRSDLVERIVGRLGERSVGRVADGVLELRIPTDRVAGLTLGLDPADFRLVQEAGLRPVPRPANFSTADGAAVGRVFAELGPMAPTARNLIFQGNEVLGYPDALEATAQELKARGWAPGLVLQPTGQGFIVQKGQERLAGLLNYGVVRVSTRVERGAAMLYIRDLPPAELKRMTAPIQTGPAVAFRYMRVGRLLQGLLSLGAAGALWLLATSGAAAGKWMAATGLALATLAFLAWPVLLPSAAAWVRASTMVLLPLLVLRRRPGGRPLQTLGFLTAAALGAGAVSRALTADPWTLLSMLPEPGAALLPAIAVAAALLLQGWREPASLRLDALLGTRELLQGLVVALALLVSLTMPGWAPVLLGAAGLSARAGPLAAPLRLTALAGAVALAAGGAGGVTAALVGLVSGALLTAIPPRSWLLIGQTWRRETT